VEHTSSTDSTVVNGLAVGTYTVTVTDLAGCTATAEATIGVIPNTGTAWYVNDNLLAGDVYTTNTGDNANTGTAACPLATLNFAISLASDDDIIYVDAGTYTENVNITNPLTLLGANANVPYGDPLRGTESLIQAATDGSAPVSMTGAGVTDNVTINGFAITGDMSNNAIYCGVDGPSNLTYHL
jgi:hypothetical protein